MARRSIIMNQNSDRSDQPGQQQPAAAIVDQYTAMDWNELRRAATATGQVPVMGRNRQQIEADLRGLG